MTASAPPPTSSAAPDSLWGAIASSNPPPRPLFSPLPRPPHQHLFWGGLWWALDEFHAPAQGLFHPVGALALPSVAHLKPQVRDAGELHASSPQQGLDPLVIQHLGAHDLGFEHEAFGIHQQMPLLRPITFLPPS